MLLNSSSSNQGLWWGTRAASVPTRDFSRLVWIRALWIDAYAFSRTPELSESVARRVTKGTRACNESTFLRSTHHHHYFKKVKQMFRRDFAYQYDSCFISGCNWLIRDPSGILPCFSLQVGVVYCNTVSVIFLYNNSKHRLLFVSGSCDRKNMSCYHAALLNVCCTYCTVWWHFCLCSDYGLLTFVASSTRHDWGFSVVDVWQKRNSGEMEEKEITRREHLEVAMTSLASNTSSLITIKKAGFALSPQLEIWVSGDLHDSRCLHLHII